MTFSLSTASKRNREGIYPQLIDIGDLAITITLIDFGYGPDSGLRIAKRQNELHLSGASPHCDGYIIESEHQTGKALDFYAYVDGRASWQPEHLALVAAAHLQAAAQLGHSVKWGGLWKRKAGGIYGWDMPHIQLSE